MAAERTRTTRSGRSAKADPACVAAVDLARAAVLAELGDWGPRGRPAPVREGPAPEQDEQAPQQEEPAADVEPEPAYLGHVVEGDRLVSHRFASTDPAYRGWYWSVTVVRASRARDVTINEVVLLPGDDAMLAQPWVPWEDRIGPGDIAPGVLMPTPDDDVRLEPGYTGGEDAASTDPAEASQFRAVVAELGLGRERVLSIDGRDRAVERWLASDGGPDTPLANQAPAPCATCGYFVRLGGSFGALFGACANEFSPSDGRVVSIDHGCGGHSDVVDERRPAEPSGPVWDSVSWDSEGTLFE